MGLKISAAFPSKFLKADDLQDRQVQVIMKHIEIDEIGDDRKPVLYFEGKEKGLVLNKTNSRTIAKVYGDDTDGWLGRPIIIFPMMVDFKGDTVIAIRVRVPQLKSAPIMPAAPAAPAHPVPAAEDPAAGMDDEIPF